MAEEIFEKRLYIGGLFDGVTEEEIRLRFKPYGHVKSVQIVKKENQNEAANLNFAYMSLSTDKVRLNKCIQLYNNTKWKGGKLKIQIAKENFMQRLKREREEAKELEKIKEENIDKEIIPVPEQYGNDKTTAGQILGEDKNWVVGKYGRILPMLNLKKNVIDVSLDPSKRAHQVKKLYAGGQKNITGDALTWDMATDNRPITAQRTGKTTLKEHVASDNVRSRLEVIAEMRGTTVEEMNRLEVVAAEQRDHRRRFIQGSCQGGEDDEDFETIDAGDFNDEVAAQKGANHRQDEEEYNSADTEEMITQMKKPQSACTSSEPNSKEKLSAVEVDYVDKPKKLSKKKSKKLQLQKKKAALKLKKSGENGAGDDVKQEKDKEDVVQILSDSDTDNDLSVDEEIPMERRGFCGTVNYLKSNPLNSSTAATSSKKTPKETNGSTTSSNLKSTTKHKEEEKDEKPVKAKKKKTTDIRGGAKRVYHSSDSEEETNATSDWRKCRSNYSAVGGYDDYVNNDISGYGDPTTPDERGRGEGYFDGGEDSLECKGDIFDLIESGVTEKSLLQRNAVGGEDGSPSKTKKVKQKKVVIEEVSESAKSVGESKKSKNKGDVTKKIKREVIELDDSEEEKTKSKKIVTVNDSTPKSKEKKEKSKKKKQRNNSVDEEKLHKPDAKLIEVKDEGETKKIKREVIELDDSEEEKTKSKKTVSVNDSTVKSKEKKEKSKKKKQRNNNVDEEKLHKPDAKLIEVKDEVGEIEGGEGTEENNFKMKFDKRKQSNEKRLSSLKHKQTDTQSQQAKISQALKHIDKSFSTKKIIFSESENEEVIEIDKKPVIKEKSLKLFDDQASSDDEEKDQKMFEIRQQFQGKAGAELMHLQSRFKSDDRFKLDKRFMNSASEDESDNEKEDNSEKKQSLNILKDVLGEKEMTRLNKKEERRGKFKDISTLQYDPNAENRSKFELQSDDEDNNKTKRIPRKLSKTLPLDDDVGKQMAKETIAEKVPGQFFSVDSTLKESMKTADSSSFSFGFNTDMSEGQPSIQKLFGNEYKTEAVPTLANDLLSWKMKFDDESENEDDIDDTVKSVAVKKNVMIPDTFFFAKDDPRIQEGINWLCRTQGKGVIRANWKLKRSDLILDYQLRRKRAMRNIKIQKSSKRKSIK